MLWRRLDVPGQDACRLTGSDDGWQLEGTAVFLHAGAPAQLRYRVNCDGEWRTRSGTVDGWVGKRSIDVAVSRAADGTWMLNGTAVSGVEHCVDLDLGFTPSTNALQLRRVALEEGAGADVPVAWLNLEDATLTLLQQRYERKSKDAYWYEAPRFGYAATLEVNELGFPQRYPDLWAAVS